MLQLKKDWNYVVNFTGTIFISIIISFFLCIFLGLIFLPQYKEFFKDIFQSSQIFIITMLGIYPICIFKAIGPESKSGKPYLNTRNLPYTNKQLFIKSIKPGLMIIPVIIIGISLINIFFINDSKGSLSIYMFLLANPFLIFCGIMISNFQILTGMIISLSRGIKGYRVIIGMLLANFFLGGGCMLISYFVGKEIVDTLYWAFVILSIYFIFSFSAFLVVFKDIENINR